MLPRRLLLRADRGERLIRCRGVELGCKTRQVLLEVDGVVIVVMDRASWREESEARRAACARGRSTNAGLASPEAVMGSFWSEILVRDRSGIRHMNVRPCRQQIRRSSAELRGNAALFRFFQHQCPLV